MRETTERAFITAWARPRDDEGWSVCVPVPAGGVRYLDVTAGDGAGRLRDDLAAMLDLPGDGFDLMVAV